MTQEIITSPWSADSSPFSKRVGQVLAVIDAIFPRATYWNAGPSHPAGPDDVLIVDSPDYTYPNIGQLAPLWEKTVVHFGVQGKAADDLFVHCSAYSEQMTFGVGVFFDKFMFSIETEPEDTKRALSELLDHFLDLLRGIGSSPAIGGCWLRNHSAFAGDPVYLYEPKRLFSKFNNPLSYEEVTDEVRALRESVRRVLSPHDFEEILTDLGANVEKISTDKLFVQLGDPLKEKGGFDILKKLEKEISLVLKEAG